jgi:hypothetical protein
MKITKNTIKKSVRTFIQAAVGYVVVNLATYAAGIDYNDSNAVKTVAIGLAIAAVSAGVAAVMNLESEV